LYRLSALQTSFPRLHYSVLALLAFSIGVCFLLETDQDLLNYLNAVQVKILYAMLVGTYASIAVICIDLTDPAASSG